jgi:hypothetical protein
MTGKDVGAQVITMFDTLIRGLPYADGAISAVRDALAPCVVLTAEEAALARSCLWQVMVPTDKIADREKAVALLTPTDQEDADG